MDFFGKVGFQFNAQFTDDTAARMTVSEDVYVMLLTKTNSRHSLQNKLRIGTKFTEVLLRFSAASRMKSMNSSARRSRRRHNLQGCAQDHGFMYGHGFQDPDGHIRELALTDASPVKRA